jgi:hypothetical protein
MRTGSFAVTVAILAAAAFLAGRRPSEIVAIVSRPGPATEGVAVSEPARVPDAVALPVRETPLKERLALADRADLASLEEELQARLLEDRAFAAVLFDAFRIEPDPVMMSFLANVLASDPPVRNAAVWQERFMDVAEHDISFERRAAAMLFLQQAETIRAVMDRMLSLAENDRELCAHALAALKGLPESRRPDPRVAALAGRIADRDPDPTLRGIALRVEDDPAHAARFLSDPDRTVRLQASRVSTSREALSAALKGESDAEVRELLQFRLDELK